MKTRVGLKMEIPERQRQLLGRVTAVLAASPRTSRLKLGTDDILSFQLLDGDGSNRNFHRLKSQKFTCIAVTPGEADGAWLREAEAAWKIGSHLFESGVPVPEMYGYDAATGLILYEDLGGRHLYDVAAATDRDEQVQLARLKNLYRDVLGNLAYMQVKGREGFDDRWCWDTPYYDRNLMLERESGYFFNAFWKDLLNQEDVDGLQEDFHILAERASAPSNEYFLHRDFQSRNIMIKDGKARFIDFQGGRKGPLGYDAASLLIDPYSSLPCGLQDDLLDHYIDCLGQFIQVDTESFKVAYIALALQRNLQIIGAFSYLSLRCGKPKFRQYIRPALETLNSLLRSERAPCLKTLKEVALKSLELTSEGIS